VSPCREPENAAKQAEQLRHAGSRVNTNRTAITASYVPVSASIAAETCAAPQSPAGSERKWRDDPRQHEKRAQEIAPYAWRVDRHQRSSDAFTLTQHPRRGLVLRAKPPPEHSIDERKTSHHVKG